jgi:hypothetical protein
MIESQHEAAVNGGSSDRTVEIAAPYARVLITPPGAPSK